MESIPNVNVQPVQTVQAPQSATTSLRQMLGGGTQTASDPFAAMLQQLLGEVEGDGEQDTLAAMLQLLAADTEQDAEEMGGQLAAEMLLTMPGLQPDTLLALLQSGTLSQDAQMVIQSLLPAEMSATDVADPAAAARALSETLSAQPLVATAEGEPTDAGATDAQKVFTVLSASQPAEQSAPRVGLQLDPGSLRAARQLLEKDRQETPVEALDIESLQQAVDTGRYLRTEATPAQTLPEVPSGEELAAQVKTGLQANALTGKSEFVVRLKPEGIGEIVVRMSEDKDKISLSILTTSTQTARLLTSEVAALQNALRPLSAEVQEITVVSGNEQAAQYSAQNQMTDQGRQSTHQQENHGQHHPRTFAEEDPDTLVQAAAPQAADGLDAYV